MEEPKEITCRDVRRALRLSKGGMAVFLGVSRQAYYRWEKSGWQPKYVGWACKRIDREYLLYHEPKLKAVMKPGRWNELFVAALEKPLLEAE